MRKMTLSKKEVDENEVNEQVDKIIKTCLKAAKDGKRSETIMGFNDKDVIKKLKKLGYRVTLTYSPSNCFLKVGW